MPCFRITTPDGKISGFIRTAKPRRKKCRWCKAWATRFCDGKVPGKAGDCDNPMCANHGVEIGRQVIDGKEQSKDHCPDCCRAVLHGESR